VSADGAGPKLRSTPIPATGYLIVRGEETDTDQLRQSAHRFLERYPGWHLFGVSGFYAPSEAAVAAICAEKLPMWEFITVYRVEDLLASGLDIEATGRTPHVTMLHADLDELVERLTHSVHERRQNPYHEINSGRRNQ